MASKEIYTSASGIRFFGGLEWRPLDASKSVDSQLRVHGGERLATHVATVKSNLRETIQIGKKTKEINRTAGGFVVDAESSNLRKKAHSLAAAFAVWAQDHHSALLSVMVNNKGQHAIVVLINGLPVLDKVVASSEDADVLAQSYLKDYPSISIFADDLGRFPSSLVSEGLLEQIAQACSKASAIRSIPADVVKLALIGAVVLAISGGYWMYSKHKDEQARKEALARLAEEDPSPKYLAALADQGRRFGATRDSLISAYHAAERIPASVEGWKLDKIMCGKDLGCVADFSRTTGTFEGLKAALPFLSLDETTSLDFNRARMSWKQEIVKAGIPTAPSMSLEKFIYSPDGSELQDWMVAGLNIQIQPSSLWPQVPGVPANFKHPSAVALGKFEVSNVTLPLLEEVLSGAPENVIWSGWVIDVGDAKQPVLSRATARVLGSYYVQN